MHIGLAIKARSDSGVEYDGPHDIYLDDTNNLAMVTGAEAVGQHARQRTRTYENEWFLDTTAGVPWLEQILGGRPDLALTEAVLKAEILDTDGATGIGAFSQRFDRRTRGVLVETLEVQTIYDSE